MSDVLAKWSQVGWASCSTDCAIPPAEAVNYSLCPLVPKGAQVQRTCQSVQGQVSAKWKKSLLVAAQWDNAPAWASTSVCQFAVSTSNRSFQLGLLCWQFVRLSRAPISWCLAIYCAVLFVCWRAIITSFIKLITNPLASREGSQLGSQTTAFHQPLPPSHEIKFVLGQWTES